MKRMYVLCGTDFLEIRPMFSITQNRIQSLKKREVFGFDTVDWDWTHGLMCTLVRISHTLSFTAIWKHRIGSLILFSTLSWTTSKVGRWCSSGRFSQDT